MRVSEPEPLVIARALVTGFLCAEAGRLAFYLGTSFATTLPSQSIWVLITGILTAMVTLIYAMKRRAFSLVTQILLSRRIDLLVIVIVGGWLNELIVTSSHWVKVHSAFKTASPHWVLLVLMLFGCIMLPIVFSKNKKTVPGSRFISDEEISDETQDLLGLTEQAKLFAEAVLESEAH